MDILFFINSALLGVGLAMDAFSVSIADGLNDPGMKARRACIIAGVFALFQAVMPMLGWVCVHTILRYFEVFEKLIPWIALTLLAYIGGKMIYEGVRKRGGTDSASSQIGFAALMVQGIATSIDALSVGFTIAGYNAVMALICALIISVVTFIICIFGLLIGKKFGTALSNKAEIFGGCILVGIGLEIFIKSMI
ncbi:MAG: manganese efflux pump MntP family protein [Eubacteriaceae bacterium]|jgi:putative Mn2+ efflux pump MntP|nr:manganese efflux pump MntP family protein [Eubacteriaceae bacterium]